MEFINYQHLETLLPQLQDHFKQGQPFPHVLIEQLLRPELIPEMIQNFPQENSPYFHPTHWYSVRGHNTVGRNLPDYYQRFFDEVCAEKFLFYLRQIVGIPELSADSTLAGSGLELGLPGAFSALHTDPFLHPHKRQWQSVVTVLFYLSDPWRDDYHGHLELWDREKRQLAQRFAPVAGRCLIFENSPRAFHGYPRPIAQPPGLYRRSILLWYYRQSAQVGFRPIRYFMPEKGLSKKARTWIENQLIWIYSFLRLHLKFNDRLAAWFSHLRQ